MRCATLLLATAFMLAGCDLSMNRQPRAAPERSASLWPSGPAIQPPPAGVIAFGRAAQGGDRPPPMSLALLERGRERFDIYCMACHGLRGHADGPVVQRGFPAPPSFDNPRLLGAPISHFYDVASNGYGIMYGYGDRVPPSDRWAIAAYVRALQVADRGDAAGAPPGKARAP
jgi:mono/diheme cytochrome c family protein